MNYKTNELRIKGADICERVSNLEMQLKKVITDDEKHTQIDYHL